jgi:hypothetical protein
MKIRSSSDAWEWLQPLLADMQISSFFRLRNYGNEEVELFFLIVCIGENTKATARYDTKEKVLYWDVVFSYSEMKYAKEEDRKFMLANGIINSFDILDNYNKSRKLHIDKQKIQEDARFYFEGLGWL